MSLKSNVKRKLRKVSLLVNAVSMVCKKSERRVQFPVENHKGSEKREILSINRGVFTKKIKKKRGAVGPFK